MRPPRNGDRVMYYPQPMDKMSEMGQPLLAFVTHVWNPTCVSLMVVDVHGMCHGRSSIYLHADQMTPKPKNGFCEWRADAT